MLGFVTVMTIAALVLLVMWRKGVFRLSWHYAPDGEYVDCPECGGFGAVRFSDRMPFDERDKANYTLGQLKAQSYHCQMCGGLERIFQPYE
jgi:hypothetical protein